MAALPHPDRRVSLTAAQPDNNVVRTAVEAMAAVLGGTNSLHTNALDEVLALPSEKAAEIALRTQQVIMEETGVLNVADPLGGSWYIEALTDRLEEEAERIFARIEDMGGDGTILSGLLRGIEDGYFTGEIADSAFAYQQALEKGDKHQVGVTVHTETIEEPLEILRISHEVEKAQVAALGQRRAARDEAAVTQSLRALRENSTTDTNMIPVLLEATRREATLGEICNVLREQWGEYSSRRTSEPLGRRDCCSGWCPEQWGVVGMPDGRPRLLVLCQLVVVNLCVQASGVVVVPGVGGVLGS